MFQSSDPDRLNSGLTVAAPAVSPTPPRTSVPPPVEALLWRSVSMLVVVNVSGPAATCTMPDRTTSPTALEIESNAVASVP